MNGRWSFNMCWKFNKLKIVHQSGLQKCRSYELLRLIGNSFNHISIHKYSSNNQQDNSSHTYKSNFTKFLISAALASSAVALYYNINSDKTLVHALEKRTIPGVRIANLKTFTAEEVGKHDNQANGIWVYYKEGVYDITDFVAMHPGGSSKILMAAGASIEPFWEIFANHNVPEIYELLESMRIGNLDISANDEQSVKSIDPYASDPKRHEALIVNGPKPFCGETPAPMLVQSFNTPLDLFYVRNHLPVPEVDIADYEVEIAIEDNTKKTLNFEAIKKYPKHTITAAVMCGGNRRSEMNAVRPLKGLSWGVGAVGNAKWTGARLCDVLANLNINEDDWSHIQFEGLDLDPSGVPYGASIPINRALNPRADIILAYEMNGEPIPKDHGYPVRVIVPGVVGARNVKWLAKIVISKEESMSQFQRGDYKGFSPSVNWDNVDFSKSPAIQDMPVISAICSPIPGEQIDVVDGRICVKGYAWSGGGNKIVRVDITVDQGKTWHVAEDMIHDKNAKEGRHWAWTLWTANIPVDSDIHEIEIWAKAVDASYNVQPEAFEHIWNLRGLLCNAYHKVKIELKKRS